MANSLCARHGIGHRRYDGRYDVKFQKRSKTAANICKKLRRCALDDFEYARLSFDSSDLIQQHRPARFHARRERHIE